MTGTGMGTRPIDWLRERAGFVNDGRPLLHRLGLASWSLIGMIVLVGLVVYGLAAVSSLVLPLLFAMVFAVVFRPLVTRITRLGLRPAAAAGLMVVGLLAVCGGVVVMTINGVDVFTGNRAAALDVDDDGIVNNVDYLEGSVPSGVKVGAVPAAATIVRKPPSPPGSPAVPCAEFKLINTSEGTIVRVGGSCGRVPSRRASWEQLQ